MALFKKSTVVAEKKQPIFHIGKSNRDKKISEVLGKEVSEAFKGTISKDFNDLLFKQTEAEPHPFNYEDIKIISKKYGPISGAVNKFINYTVSAGMYVRSDNPRAQMIIEQFMDDVNLKYHTKRWLKQSLRKGFSPLEIGFDKDAQGNTIVTGVKTLNANNIFKIRDDFGNVTGYIQIKQSAMNGKLHAGMFNEDNIIKFNPKQILSLDINQGEDEPYGLGIIYPNMYVIQNLLNAEMEMHMLLERKANSPIHVKMGKYDKDIFPTNEAVDNMKTSLSDLRNDQEWVTDDTVEMNVLDFGKIGEKFDTILDHDLKQLSTGLEVPQVLLGYGNIPEGLAQTQLDDFERAIANVKDEIERMFEDHLFKIVLEANGIQDKVELLFGSPSQTEKDKRIVQITNLLNNMMISNELRFKLELELADLMGFDTNDLVPPEKKTEELMDQEQPAVPGQNRNLGKQSNDGIIDISNTTATFNVCEHDHNHYMKEEADYYIHNNIQITEKYLEEHPDVTIKEWLGFNYQSFLNKIFAAIDAYEFPELKGITAQDFSNGKLTDFQIERLRGVLRNGFEEGKSIRDITQDIKDNVGLKDLKGTNKHGKDFVISKEVRAPMIARTETTRMGAQGNVLNYKDNDIEEVQYLAVFDERTSDICQELNGQIFNIKDAMNIIPAHPFCRSTWVPKTELD
ncbi:MAG: phage portal protein family protein [bacterium]